MLEPLSSIAQRLRSRLRREYSRMIEPLRWSVTASHPAVRPSDHLPLCWRMDKLNAHWWTQNIATNDEAISALRIQADRLMRHQFDLLGSGPVIVRHGCTCKGLQEHRYHMPRAAPPDSAGRWIEQHINRTNRIESRRIWALVGKDYDAIDWQLDFKSGYRWPEHIPSAKLSFGHMQGVDVKVPWELARMQHLPVLALACRAAQQGHKGFQDPETYRAEIRNQLLDFLASNPPAFGVNWICPMDVGIRVANILISIDLLGGYESFENDPFTSILTAAVRAHGEFLATHLEWSPKYRGNHYLANLAGLLFCGAYLPSNTTANLWLHFGALELMEEVGHQFHKDGSNFEASTSYHRLSAEIVLWCLALLSRLPPDKEHVLLGNRVWPGPLPPARDLNPVANEALLACSTKLYAMGEFTRTMTRPDGCIVQFGDNDSGRFVSAWSAEQISPGTNPSSPTWNLDHRALANSIDALLGKEVLDPMGRILLAFSGNTLSINFSAAPSLSEQRSDDPTAWKDLLERSLDCSPLSVQSCEFFSTAELSRDLTLKAYLGMGCYVFKSKSLYLAIRCGEIGMNGLGAHDHCDQLGIELVIDGRDIFRDPGTYVYTPLPEERNKYRSAAAHAVPHVHGKEPADLKRGLFNLASSPKGECLYFGPEGFVGRHRGYGQWIYRLVAINKHSVLIRDYSPDCLAVSDPMPHPVPYSPGYGLLVNPD